MIAYDNTTQLQILYTHTHTHTHTHIQAGRRALILSESSPSIQRYDNANNPLWKASLFLLEADMVGSTLGWSVGWLVTSVVAVTVDPGKIVTTFVSTFSLLRMRGEPRRKNVV